MARAISNSVITRMHSLRLLPFGNLKVYCGECEYRHVQSIRLLVEISSGQVILSVVVE
jgi:hypothetical protein